jgi:hypothetical protein
MDIYQYRRLSSADANTTVTVQSNDCILGHITINATSAQALTVKDGLGNTIATLKASIAEGTYHYRVPASKGLTITVPTGYTGDATVAFR